MKTRRLAGFVIGVLALVTVGVYQARAILVNALMDFIQIGAPSNPSAGQSRVYVDSSTHQLACLNSDGSSCAPSGGGGATPAAPYLTNSGTSYLTSPLIRAVTLPVDGSFAWVNQDTATVTNQGNALALNATGRSGLNLSARTQAIGANTTLITASTCTNATDGIAHCEIGFRESGTGKLEFLYFGATVANSGASTLTVPFFAVQRYNSPTSFNNTVWTVETAPYPGPVVWVKLVYNGTTIAYYWSMDGGGNWDILFSESKTAFFTTAPDQFYYSIVTAGSTANPTHLLLHWAMS